MQTRKIIGIGLLVTIGLAFILGLTIGIGILSPANVMIWYEIDGLGILLFGIWGGIILVKN